MNEELKNKMAKALELACGITVEEVEELVEHAHDQGFREGYTQGHIDHQLVLEASTKDAAARYRDMFDAKAGTKISYSGKEILEAARREGRLSGLEEAMEIVAKQQDKERSCFCGSDEKECEKCEQFGFQNLGLCIGVSVINEAIIKAKGE